MIVPIWPRDIVFDWIQGAQPPQQRAKDGGSNSILYSKSLQYARLAGRNLQSEC